MGPFAGSSPADRHAVRGHEVGDAVCDVLVVTAVDEVGVDNVDEVVVGASVDEAFASTLYGVTGQLSGPYNVIGAQQLQEADLINARPSVPSER